VRRVCCSAAFPLVVASVLISCGGGKSNEAGTATVIGLAPTAVAPLGDVPLYPAATIEVNSGAEASGTVLAGTAAAPPAGFGVDVKSYSSVGLAVFQTSDSPAQVLDWYKSHMTGWQEHWSSVTGGSADQQASAIWTKDNGKEAAWMAANTQGGRTDLHLWFGS